MEKLILKSSFKKSLALGLITLGLVSCQRAKDELKEGFDDYVVVSGTPADQTDFRVEGTLTMRFLKTLPQLQNNSSFEIDGALYSNLAAVTLVAFAQSSLLSDGVQVRFERDGNQVRGSIRINSQDTRQIVSSRLQRVFPNDLEIVVEIQNRADGVRVLLWRGDMISKDLTSVEFDSQAPGSLSLALPAEGGLGLFAGLRLENAVITTARLRDAVLK